MKKVRERDILDRFLVTSSLFNNPQIIEGEEPDFLIETGGELLGIELVDYIRGQKKNGGSVLRESEVFADKIIKQAAEIYALKFGRPFLNVSFYPFEKIKQTKKNLDVKKMAENLAEVIHEYSSGQLHEAFDVDWEDLEKAGIDHVFSDVSVSSHDDYLDGQFWHRNGFAWATVGKEEIEALIQKKETLLPTYLEKCPKCYLVIISEGPYPSSSMILDRIRDIRFKTSFSRVFVYEYSNGYIELKKE